MIISFRNRKLKRFFLQAEIRQVGPALASRVEEALDQLDAARKPEDMNTPGNDFHSLKGKPKRYSVHVSGNFSITFEWDETDAKRVDLEDYH